MQQAEPESEPDPESTRENPFCLANLLCRRLVEESATYSFRWTDGLLGVKFEAVDALGGETVDFIGDAVELQTPLGTWLNHLYACYGLAGRRNRPAESDRTGPLAVATTAGRTYKLDTRDNDGLVFLRNPTRSARVTKKRRDEVKALEERKS